ncbi:MAG: CBS domain-containing protein [Acetobacteraceae bacterium]|nr:CBS domain-containing protein [Acetobacteraceae bacterium]
MQTDRRSMAEMVRNREPVTVEAGATIRACCALMHRHRIGAVLVVEGGRLAGIFTGRDAVRALAEGLSSETPVASVMTIRPVTISARETALDALRTLNDAGFRHLPVVEDGRILGIVSRYDFRACEHGRLDEETGFFETMR